MLVLHKSSDNDSVFEWVQPYKGVERKLQRVRQIITRYLGSRKVNRYLRGRPARWDSFTPPLPAILNAAHPLVQWADVIHLHWCAQFWNWSAFRHLSGKGLFWTFHDLNPVTGGCHFPGECRQFESRCAVCPQLEGTSNPRIVAKAFSYKERILQARDQPRVTVIAPSFWISVLAKRSSLLSRHADHAVIPYTFGESIFQPLDQSFCRDVYSLPHDKKIVLFAASYFENHRKGMDLLISAIDLLSNEDDLLFCGAGRSSRHANKIVYLGNIADERMMAMAYNAADMSVVPSREDNLPNTVGESISCGTPVVGFSRGGIPEMIQDGVNGILVSDVSAEALAEGIRRCFRTAWNEETIAHSAMEKYAPSVITGLHLAIYKTAHVS